MKYILSIALVALVSLAVTGCGGADSRNVPPPPRDEAIKTPPVEEAPAASATNSAGGGLKLQ
jgi:hypothetical protein